MLPFDDPARFDAKALAEHLDGPREARHRFAAYVLSLVERSVFFELRGHAGPGSHQDDLVSEVMVHLYRNDARVLRQWDPSRAALKGFLNMVAGRLVRRILASERAMVSLDDMGAEAEAVREDLEVALAHRAAVERLARHVLEHGSLKDRSRFRGLFVEGKSPAEVARSEGASVQALHTWASRLKRTLQAEFPQLVETLERRVTQGGHGGPRGKAKSRE